MNKMLLRCCLVLWLLAATGVVFAQETLLEYHPQDGYVLITEGGVASQNIPSDFLDKLKQLKNKKADIKSVAFSPDGKGWTIITSSGTTTKNIEGGYEAALKKLKAGKLKIKSVAFNPANWDSQHGFVIVHDKGFIAEGISSHLKEQLDKFANHTKGIKTVEFTPDGGWTVVSTAQEWSRMVQGKQIKSNFIDNIRAAYLDGQHVFTASFNPKGYSRLFGWVFITDKGYEGMNMPEKLRQDLLKFGIKPRN